MRKKLSHCVTFLLLAAVLALCAACGNGATATTMKLAQTEGKVIVHDEKEKELEPVEDMNLYSGYQLETGKAGYLWVNLDSVKMAKMDEESDVEIRKSGKDLEILLNSGALFFHVTEPLEDDETMSIRTSTMAVGIRGTCGWVDASGSGRMLVYILEGTVECSVADPGAGEILTQTVTQGEWAELLWQDGKAEITVGKFTKEDIPSFVMEERKDNPALQSQIDGILSTNAEGEDHTDNDGDTEKEESNENDGSDVSSEADADTGNVHQGPIVITTDRNELAYSSGNGSGNVIVTIKDGLYGAINLNGEEIVPNIYPSYIRTPNNEGQFVLGDNSERTAVVFDNQGNKLLEVQGLQSIRISENTIIYSFLDDDDASWVCCYDIVENEHTMQTLLEADGVSYAFEVFVAYRQDGEFFYSRSDNWRLYLAKKDGTIVSAGEALPTYPDANTAEWSESLYWWYGDMGYPVNDSYGGYIICAPWGEANYFRIYDHNMNSRIIFDLSDISFLEDTCRFQTFYDNGQWYSNKGLQVVMYDTHLEQMCYLMDFSKAQIGEYEAVTNLQDLVLAQYPYIYLSGDGYYAASDGEMWFYLDEQGNRANSYQWVSCSSFYNGYALVLEDDGMAYIIDKNFDKVTEGYPADSTYLTGGLFCIVKGDTQTIIYMP